MLMSDGRGLSSFPAKDSLKTEAPVPQEAGANFRDGAPKGPGSVRSARHG